MCKVSATSPLPPPWFKETVYRRTMKMEANSFGGRRTLCLRGSAGTESRRRHFLSSLFKERRIGLADLPPSASGPRRRRIQLRVVPKDAQLVERLAPL